MDKALLLKNICELLQGGNKEHAANFASQHYPFVNNAVIKRHCSKLQMCRVFLSDGFIDRYSGEKLVFPGLIRLLSLEFPGLFKYHPNWKMTETHPVYWELFPTIDHIVPVARNGTNDAGNLATTSMLRNAAKANWLLDELGWSLYGKGTLQNWDGLTGCFLQLYNTQVRYQQDRYVSAWKTALVKAMNDFRIR